MDDKLPDTVNNSYPPQQPTQPEPVTQIPIPDTPNLPNYPNPPLPSNPSPDLVDPAQSELAHRQLRDEHGRFKSDSSQAPLIPSDQLKTEDNILAPRSLGEVGPNSPDPSLPNPIQITHTDKYSENNDPPLVAVSVTNPITYLKKWIKKLLANEGVNIGFKLKIKPLTAIAIFLALAASFGTGYGSGLNAAAGILFPNSSPILHRAVVYQGTIQKTEAGQYFLTLPDNSLWKLTLKSPETMSTLNSSLNKQVMIKGNLTKEANVINVNEINTFDK